MRLATVFAASFYAFTGAAWVVFFMALFLGAFILERAAVRLMGRK